MQRHKHILFAFFRINVIDIIFASCCTVLNNFGKYPVFFVFWAFNTSCYHITRTRNKATVHRNSTAQRRRPSTTENTVVSEHSATSNYHTHFITRQWTFKTTKSKQQHITSASTKLWKNAVLCNDEVHCVYLFIVRVTSPSSINRSTAVGLLPYGSAAGHSRQRRRHSLLVATTVLLKVFFWFSDLHDPEVADFHLISSFSSHGTSLVKFS